VWFVTRSVALRIFDTQKSQPTVLVIITRQPQFSACPMQSAHKIRHTLLPVKKLHKLLDKATKYSVPAARFYSEAIKFMSHLFWDKSNLTHPHTHPNGFTT
jgi:hypothetical protein